MVIDSEHVRDAAAVALDATRNGFPEPTLLPHLAGALSVHDFPMLLDVVAECGEGRNAFPPWPRLIAATCAIVAPRLNEATDENVVQTLAHAHTALYSHLDGPLLDIATQSLTPASESWYEDERAERLCRLAARHPDHAGGMLVDLASAALYDLPPERSLIPSAWFLPLTDGAERREIIDAWCASDWHDLSAAAALFACAEPAEREQLTPHLLGFLADHPAPAGTTAALATLLPTLADSCRSLALAQLTSALQEVATEVPPWWFALVWSRVRAMEAGIELNFDTVDPAWRASLESLGPLPAQSDHADVLRAQPGASRWMAADGYPGFSTDSAGDLLHEVMSRWSGQEAAMAPSEEASAALPPAPVPAPPRARATRGRPEPEAAPSVRSARARGLGGLLGGLVAGGRSAVEGVVGRVLGAGTIGRVARGSRSDPTTPDASPAAQPLPERRLQADVALASETAGTNAAAGLTSAFVAGAKHNVSFSVGRGASLQVGVGFVEPDYAQDSEVESLDLRLLYNGKITGSTIELPRDTAEDSTVWEASLEVPADADSVEATLTVLHKSRVLQAARLAGPVAASPAAAAAADSKIEFVVVADVHELDHLETRGAFDASFVTDGESGAAFAGESYRVQDLRGIDTTISKMTDRLFKSTESVAMAGAGDDPAKHEALLVYLAVQGKALHSALIKPKLSALDKARRIQIVNAGKSPILPLEFVYAGPSPTHTARLCDGWREALAQGVCESCTPQPDGVRVETICPLDFWALSKVIERHAPGEPRPDGYDYSLETCVAGERDRLAPLKHALFAASDNVPEPLVEATLDTLRTIEPNAEEALTWTDWMSGVENASPTLLVSMPHNALDPVLDIPTLEIGSGSDLRAGELTRGHVCRDDAEIGPVVLLLGCQTAQSGPLPYHTFVAEFRDNGAAIVIGTLATVLGEHAAPIVQVILSELAKPADPTENTFGDLLLRMRRQMFAEGILIALAVAAFGDADWALAPAGD